MDYKMISFLRIITSLHSFLITNKFINNFEGRLKVPKVSFGQLCQSWWSKGLGYLSGIKVKY